MPTATRCGIADEYPRRSRLPSKQPTEPAAVQPRGAAEGRRDLESATASTALLVSPHVERIVRQ